MIINRETIQAVLPFVGTTNTNKDCRTQLAGLFFDYTGKKPVVVACNGSGMAVCNVDGYDIAEFYGKTFWVHIDVIKAAMKMNKRNIPVDVDNMLFGGVKFFAPDLQYPEWRRVAIVMTEQYYRDGEFSFDGDLVSMMYKAAAAVGDKAPQMFLRGNSLYYHGNSLFVRLMGLRVNLHEEPQFTAPTFD